MQDCYTEDLELADRMRQLREEIRSQVSPPGGHPSFPPPSGTMRLEQHLDQLKALATVQEQPFRSRFPVLGPLIAWFRERWNRISTKWYVLPMLQQQVHYNLALAEALRELYRFTQTTFEDLVRRMDAMFVPLDQEQAALQARLQDLKETLARRVQEQTETQTQALLRLQAALEERFQRLAREQALDRRGLAFLRLRLDRLMARLSAGCPLPPEERPAVAAERETLSDHDYFRFEAIYRPEAEVRAQQEAYLPFFTGRSNVLDLGCGKGEFLELLREHGILAYGVDWNTEMVRLCEEKGLRVVREDALRHLEGLPDGSLGGLFAAHLVEHLPPRDLTRLVALAQAKLEPGAYLIFETPNPLCLWALVNYFYLDLSHVKPIHPQALSFLLEMHGFHGIEVRYLHPVPEGVRLARLPEAGDPAWEGMAALLNLNLDRLNDLLYGYADYAIIARR
ncbi:MAG: methyltransferase domain-containing protein [Chloroflexia bacterium]